MGVVNDIIRLDNDFIKMDNQVIIDREIEIFKEFEKNRNTLIKQLEEEFKSTDISLEQKQLTLEKLKTSTNNIKQKFDSIKSQIKQNNLKTQRFKNAYQNTSKVEGTFFIDKTV